MGWVGKLVDRVRKSFVSDKDQKAVAARRGVTTSAERAGTSQGYSPSSMDSLGEHLAIAQDLMARYFDYEEMDEYPELSASLDLYADDATQVDSATHKTIWATSKNVRVAEILNDLLHNRLRMEEDAWGLVRTIGKYGDHYGEILLAEDGVVGLNYLPATTVRRIEDLGGRLLGFVQQLSGNAVSPQAFMLLLEKRKAKGEAPRDPNEPIAFEDWEVVHWRLRSKHMRSVYGTSIIDSARYAWRRLVLMEDAAVLHKLTKAPGRFAYYIDTGDMAPQQALAYVEQVKQKFRKKKYVDAQGKLNFQSNPMGMDEDIWIPVRGGKESTRIDNLGGADWQSLDDVSYFREKTFTAARTPPSALGIGGEGSRSSLAQEDVRFAKATTRLQREARNGIKKVCRVHLIAKGIDPNSVEWDVHMTVPSTIFELAQLEVKGSQAQLAAQLLDFFDKSYIRRNVFGISEAEDEAIGLRMTAQQREQMALDAEAQAQAGEIMSEPDMPQPGPDGEAPDGEDVGAARDDARSRSAAAVLRAKQQVDQDRKRAADIEKAAKMPQGKPAAKESYSAQLHLIASAARGRASADDGYARLVKQFDVLTEKLDRLDKKTDRHARMAGGPK